MGEFLRQVSKGNVKLDPLITHQFPLDEAPRAYSTILDPASGSLAVILRYPASEAAGALAGYEPRNKVTVAPARGREGELRVGLVGASNIARWSHLPGLKRIPYVHLKAVYSSSGVRGKGYARRFGAEYCCTDYGEILDDPEIDVVIITSRHQYHYDQAIAALRAGKHVFVEKPMGITEHECVSLFGAVAETGRELAVGFNRRFAPFYREMKKHLVGREGAAVLNCSVSSPGMTRAFWGSDPAIGGAIVGEAVHFIDLMFWLLESEPVGVSAFSLPIGREDPIGENNIAASFRFADGSIGNLTYCTIGGAKSGGERVEAFIKGARIVVEDFKRFSIRTRVTRTRLRLWPQKGFAAQMESFFARLREGQTPEVTVRDGARATIGALRMLESARTLRPCAIGLDEALR